MARIKIADEAKEAVGTNEMKDESIWEGTVEFASTGTSQELPSEVAEQYVEEYGHLVPYEDTSESNE